MVVPGSELNESGVNSLRILHLVDGSRSERASTRLEHVQDLTDGRPDDVVVSVGGSPDGVHGSLPGGARFPWSRSGLFKSLLRKRHWGEAGFDVVHAWGVRSAAMAAGLESGQPVTITLDGFDASDPMAASAASMMLSGRAASAFGSSHSLERASALVGGTRRGSGGEEIIEPILNPDRFHVRDERLRQSWGADSDTLVMGIIGSPIEQLNLFEHCSMGPRCSMFHDRIVLVASSRGARRGDLVRWLDGAGLGMELVFDDRIESIEHVAASLDVAVATSSIACRNRVCDVAPAIAAAAAGVPVVLGVDHPAGEYSSQHPLLYPCVPHGEHEASKWLARRFVEKMPADGQAWRDRWAGYVQDLAILYQRAMSLSGDSSFIAAS